MEEKYKLNPKAIADILDSIKYDEAISHKVEDEFINDVFSSIGQLSNKPKSHSLYFEETRKASLSKFPFNVIYTVVSPIIVILADWHKRREERWKLILNEVDL